MAETSVSIAARLPEWMVEQVDRLAEEDGRTRGGWLSFHLRAMLIEKFGMVAPEEEKADARQ
jgi:hypothetical protein